MKPAFLVLLLCFALTCYGKTINDILRHRPQPHNLTRALHFLHKVQNANCSGPYAVVTMGVWGGFAAQFQLASAEWMRAIAGLEFQVPVLIVGRLMGYSDAAACKHVHHDWTCYFHPSSSCQGQLLATGKRIEAKYPPNDEAAVPKELGVSFAFWWGAVQLYLFNVKPFVEEHIAHHIASMNRGHGFTLGKSCCWC